LANREPLNVLIASYLEPEFVARIRHEVPEVTVLYYADLLGPPRYIADHTAPVNRSPEQEAQWQALLAKADVLFDFDASHREDLPDLAPNLKWIQATSAGIGQFVRRMGYAERADWKFTTASGVHARPLAEFAIMSMLMFAKDFTYLQAEKEARHWQRYCATELRRLTLGIIGLGKIGREIARLAKAFDMTVIGTRRHPGNETLLCVDSLFGPDDLDSVLRQSHFLVLSAPHTDETDRLIGRAELALLPRGAVLINIARGNVVDQSALIESLRSGHLRGAALDVFEVEPLPPDDPLWTMPNVIISPHSASTADSENEKLTRLFCDNLKRFLAGDDLVNLLDVGRLY
jgi:phosphoglycerate dehydrogenase-like enzyme